MNFFKEYFKNIKEYFKNKRIVKVAFRNECFRNWMVRLHFAHKLEEAGDKQQLNNLNSKELLDAKGYLQPG